MPKRPPFIRHWREIEQTDGDGNHYPGDPELMSIGAAFGHVFGFVDIGVHHERLPPGRRTSYPHAERDEEEFVFVLEGTPDVWVDGVLHRCGPGDGIGFPKGTGVAHTILNNTDADVRLLVMGEASKKRGKVLYPLNPKRAAEMGERNWSDAPKRRLGPHDGLPDARRKKPRR